MKKMWKRHLILLIFVLCVISGIKSEIYASAEQEETTIDEIVESEIVGGQIQIVNLNVLEGKFDVVATELVDNSSIKELQIGIWNEENGQDDIVWFSTSAEEGWTVSDSIQNHDYSLGKYIVHAYAKTVSGQMILVDTATCFLDCIREKPIYEPIKNNEQYRLSISDIMIPGGISKVQFAVWSDQDGQDDIRWYTAKNDGDFYTYNWSVENHKGLGTYNIHAYATSLGGKMIMMGKTTLSIDSPYAVISIPKIDDSQGTFQILISDFANSNLLKTIQIAVWSEYGGQDDLKWYTVNNTGQDAYTLEVNIKDHKYSVGKYCVHMYFTDITGYQYYVNATACELKVVSEHLEVKQKNSVQYDIKLTNLKVPGGVQTVKFPVWSEVNGQDDIKWYNAVQTGMDTYSATIFLSNHKGLGQYFVHAYAVTKGNEYILIGNSSFKEEEPELNNVKIADYDISAGTFKVLLTDITNTDVLKEIYVPVWSAANGQDDIQWYRAKKKNDGTYYISVDIKNHKYSLGKYYAHIYFTDITGYQYLAGSISESIEIETGDLSIKQNSKKEYVVELKNVVIPGGAKQIEFPTWSNANGQDDVKWYIASKDLDGVYRYKINVSNHTGLGDFTIHAYAKMQNNFTAFIGATGFKTEVPSVEEVKVSTNSKSNGEFQVKVMGIENPELISRVQIPIWSTSNQSDIVWYTATKNNDGDYVVNVNISRHRYNCAKYNVHVYLTDITGIQRFVGATVCDKRPQFKEFMVKDVDDTESQYKVTLSGLVVPAGEKEIQFAVWGAKDGQNDIQWYKASKQGDGNYTYTFKIKNHKEPGEYNVHAYCITKGNAYQIIGTTNFSVNKTPNMAAAIVSDINGTAGTFKITVSGLFAASGIEKVQIPVWCSNNQSDIVWYTATKSLEGVYAVTVNVSKHSNHFGIYKAHVYVTMGNGIRLFTGSASATIEPKNYVYSTYINETKRQVGIIGATASRVQFPTWSSANGQDDIVWYEGTNQGNGKWTATVDSAKHKNGGTYITHVYTTCNGIESMAGSLKYSLEWIPTDQSLMSARANMYSSTTAYLILVNRSTHKVGVFQGWQGNWNNIRYWDCGDGAVSTPTVEGTFRIGSRGYYFDSGSARCYWWTQFYGNYLFHSVLYNKNGTLMDGRVGMALSHGCVRLFIENAKWIYDTIPTGTTVVVYH